MNNINKLHATIIISVFFGSVSASEVGTTITFTSGSAAISSEVNNNFTTLSTSINDNNSRIANLESTISTLMITITTLQTLLNNKAEISHNHIQSDITNLSSDIGTLQSDVSVINNNSVLLLDNYLSYTIDANGYPTALFEGVNLQVINGIDQLTPNGTGNIIVGFNNPRNSTPVCSSGNHITKTSCETAGKTWSINHKSGSHNFVGGSKNGYSATGGFIVGSNNIINNFHSVVSGGEKNIASGILSNVNGGNENISSASHSSINGGARNKATGFVSSITGGLKNSTNGSYSSVSGGFLNNANGHFSSVSGGKWNTSKGESSSVSGGVSHTAHGIYDWKAGTLFQDL